MNHRTLIICLGFPSACTHTATLVATSEQYGGRSDGPRWAVLEYRIGSGIIARMSGTEAQEESAKATMRDFCAPSDYRVVDISRRSELRKPTVVIKAGSQDNSPTLKSETVVTIKFECVEELRQAGADLVK